MNKKTKSLILLISIFIAINILSFLLFSNQSFSLLGAQTRGNLWSYGYALLPEPQRIEFKGSEFNFGSDWRLELLSGIESRNIAVKTFLDRLNKQFKIRLSTKKSGNNSNEKIIQLDIRTGSAAVGKKEALACQGYILELKPDKISICGNDNPGLFYGIQTFLQLLCSKTKHRLPVCKIEDWPDLELRIIHWCEKHHQNRIKTLKRYIDQAAEYKINAIGWQLEDKFAYKKHPVIGVPGAFTREQVREIDKYARERYIELVPIIDCPAHMSYVLKHPEFAHLREDINNNYMMCPYKEKGWDLLYDMFDELIEAFPGKYIHVSTDELYFLGTGIECGCAEKVKNGGRSRIFVDFMNKAAKYLESKGKEVMFWGESPLDAQDITKLPKTLIDAIAGHGSYDREGELAIQSKHGMRVMIYSSVYGSERFFPNYSQRLNNVYKNISLGEVKKKNDVLGTFIAAWDDSGPHDEVFWQGWVAGTSYAWNGKTPKPEKLTANFMKIFYGNKAVNMEEIYKLMYEGALFWRNSWNRIQEKGVTWELSMQGIPTTLKPIYGYWEKPYIFPIPRPRRIASLELPNLPDPNTLYNRPYWRDRYRINLKNIVKEKQANTRLIKLLNNNLNRVSKNKYNIEVLLSMAELFRHNINLLETLGAIEDTLSSAAENYLDYKHSISCLICVEKLAENVSKKREKIYQKLKTTWEKSRYPKGQTVNGRKFVHILDDTKNHYADLTPDLSYIIMRERNLNLEKWICELKEIRHTFTLKHQFK